jgi:dTDP-4-dehydrorhamnose 3,5-epimerase
MKPFEEGVRKKLGFEVKEVLVSRNRKGVFRGMHYQKPEPQAKIIWCARGRIYDILLDMRRRSRTYGKWLGIELSEANRRGVYLPEGLAHGILSLEEGSEVVYLLGNERRAECERGIRYNDPKIAILLPKIKGKLIISERDANFPLFKDAVKF